MVKFKSRNEARVKRHRRTKNIKGNANCPRISVFRSNRYLYVQLIDDQAHKTLLSLSTEKMGLDNGKNIEAAKKLGTLVASEAKKLKIECAVFDRSGYIYHGKIQAIAEAAREGGLKF